MKVLAACEESQAVAKAFRLLGHEAYSCDIEPCSGGHPEWHIQCDALELLKLRWDMIISLYFAFFCLVLYLVHLRTIFLRMSSWLLRMIIRFLSWLYKVLPILLLNRPVV